MSKGGSKPGERRGGRQKGTPNKAAQALRDDMAEAGEIPLSYMLRVMRDRSADDERRDKMAIAAAAFMHPKLSSTEATLNANVKHESLLDRVAQAEENGTL